MFSSPKADDGQTAASPRTPRHSLGFLGLLLVLLGVEASLLLSQQFRWFAFNDLKGWAVLICVALVGAALALTALWLLAQAIFRRRPQFGLRAMLALVLVVAIPCGWMTQEMRKAARQREIVKELRGLNCGVFYDYNLSSSGEFQHFTGERPGVTRLHAWLGDDFFHDIVGASPKSDAALAPLSELASIRTLSIDNSEVTDQGLQSIAPLKQLQWLDLRDAHHVSDAGLTPLREMRQLEGLLLRRTQVGDAGMACLKDLKSLQFLDLGMTPVGDAGLAQLAGLTRLRQLSFWGNKITDAGAVHLRGMTELRTLDLGGASLTDAGTEHLKGLRQLEMLGLRGCRVTDAGLSCAAEMPQLRQLDLFNTQVSDASLPLLASLSRLESVHLGETKITPEGANWLRQKLPKCRVD